MPQQSLPAPGADARRHSRRLLAHIRREIERQGGIGFARFMELALYAPGLGYYSAGSHKLGEQGDFVTAPEVSGLFSRALAAQCAELLGGLDRGELLELGAGSGVMAAEMLLALQALGCLPCRYSIVETSADLRVRQRDTIRARAGELSAHVRWLDAPPAQPIRGVVLGNEIVDALPVERFRIQDGRVLRLGVGWDGGLVERAHAADADLVAAVRQIEQDLGRALPEGYESEICLQLPAWIATVAEALERGVMLLIDYGLPRREYYLPERCHGTLMCHYRHRAHADPFWYPGLQDITAWVDFSAVATAAHAAGLRVAGYTTQAHFLLAAGMEALLAETRETDGSLPPALARQARTLLMPGEMGERFKVIALARDCSQALRGFTLRDLSGRL